MSDPWFEEMDPVEKALMFFNWVEDFNDEQKALENQGYLIGTFINPEMVKKMLGGDKEFASTDEEFEKLSEKILETNRQEETPTRKRKRRKLIKD
jgi:hypothetical protein